jgi:hypothetical protein
MRQDTNVSEDLVASIFRVKINHGLNVYSRKNFKFLIYYTYLLEFRHYLPYWK